MGNIFIAGKKKIIKAIFEIQDIYTWIIPLP